MEIANEMSTIKKRHRGQKKVLTREFKKIKDAHTRVIKLRDELDSLTKLENQIIDSISQCDKKTCKDHHSKIYSRCLTILKKMTEEIKTTREEIVSMALKLNEDQEMVQKIQGGLLETQFNMMREITKTRSSSTDTNGIHTYKNYSISSQDDSFWEIHNDRSITESQ
jgi:hypothetical protein